MSTLIAMLPSIILTLFIVSIFLIVVMPEITKESEKNNKLEKESNMRNHVNMEKNTNNMEIINNVVKKNITNNVLDLVSSLLYYDRKEDEDLPVGAIEKAIVDGVVTEEEIVNIFTEELHKNMTLR